MWISFFFLIVIFPGWLQIPDGVVVELEQVGEFVQQDGTRVSNNDLFNSNLTEEDTVVEWCSQIYPSAFIYSP